MIRGALLCTALAGAAAAQHVPALTHGPLRGHADTQTICVWARASAAGSYALHLQSLVDGAQTDCLAEARPEADLTLTFRATGLAPGTAHEFWVTCGEHVVHARGSAPLVTAVPDDAAEATIAFGSCANERAFPEQPIWGQILARAPQALVLLGDTPYVDDGTVEGRRRRHRAFFEFAPVRATLGAIPTWTTWDDHDYATNDTFGATKGSETARGVFVEYHAHASFGDGARGIYTGFRRGPIEVFLLDTRSFADTEPSVLAPGERSLLGKAQTEWLQRGLRASTATFRVLACGMVWNGGVRPNKPDCWGNWLPERDALLRWIGAQHIPGVVLVSGDVHRTRVILHPVKALAGYDVPEFVTSPLAQSILETNAVPVPGLEFDAGEPHSCLLLSARVVAGAETLTARFVAGDGREFHVRHCQGRDLAAPDAAAAYRRAAERLRSAFGEDHERLPEPGTGQPHGVAAAAATDEAWRRTVALAAPALAEWRDAVQQPRCRFARVGRQPQSTEFLDLLRCFTALHRLLSARGHQAIADRDAEALVSTVTGLLAMGRHLEEEPTTLAWILATEGEHVAAELVRAACANGDEGVVASLRAAVALHEERRRAIASLGVVVQEEFDRLLGGLVQAAQLAEGADAATARRFGDEVRRQARGLLHHGVEPLERAGSEADAGVRAELVRRADEFQRQFAEVQERRKQAGATAGETPAADLAVLFTGIAAANWVAMLDATEASRRALREAAAR